MRSVVDSAELFQQMGHYMLRPLYVLGVTAGEPVSQHHKGGSALCSSCLQTWRPHHLPAACGVCELGPIAYLGSAQ